MQVLLMDGSNPQPHTVLNFRTSDLHDGEFPALLALAFRATLKMNQIL
jgi:hypothetical protein